MKNKKFWDDIAFNEDLEGKEPLQIEYPNLKATTKPISIRLPISTIEQLKSEANKVDMPYQSLIKLFIAQGLSYSQINLVDNLKKAIEIAFESIKSINISYSNYQFSNISTINSPVTFDIDDIKLENNLIYNFRHPSRSEIIGKNYIDKWDQPISTGSTIKNIIPQGENTYNNYQG